MHSYPERIIPEETTAGSLNSHLKRYDFARQFCQGKIVLDAGCGLGYGTHYLSDIAKEIRAVDISEEAIAYAKNHYNRQNIWFEAADIHNLNFPDGYFDIICAFEVIEHLNRPDKFLSEVKRTLKENGIFIISTPNAKRTSHKSNNPYHKREFCKKDFENILKKYFTTVEILGQRRRQSSLHYYLQKSDIFHLRAVLPVFLRRKICHAVATYSWDEAGLADFDISKEGLKRANELIGVCRSYVNEKDI
ncbi:MAG: class I SAM-dependent methyltransferase [Candidatus Omnitrophica bacterium]|nr:class I SAM-dependent methyltransferase [Candidatus Omnitrophota bacterium]